MSFNGKSVAAADAREIIQRLLEKSEEDDLTYRTETRSDYEMLFAAAENGHFPDVLSITRKGLRLNKRLVHAPLAQTQHQ
jgi:hypothetical protein